MKTLHLRMRNSSRTLGLALLAVYGCVVPPQSAPWRSDQDVIAPMTEGGGSALLVVETVFLGSENGRERRRPFFLYDEQGHYLDHYPNDFMSPVHLAPGRYVVVTGVLTSNKRVQAVLRDGMTTQIRLTDFQSAPEVQ
jgi:hypothetical protein